MRILENLKLLKSIEFDLERFLKLPKKAQELIVNVFYNYLIEHNSNNLFILTEVVDLMGNDEIKSPIEKIFEIACNIVFSLRNDELKECWISTEVQKKIKCKKKTYYADFLFFITNNDDDFLSKKLIVECDGHEFHKATKQQVKNDNEREFDFKIQGYEVLRFSGTQIYENPIKCANDTFDYLLCLREKEGI